jgi:hypothetical protein
MLSYIKLKKNPHNFLQLKGLKVSEFDNIVNLLHEPWSKIESQKKCHGRTSHLLTLEDISFMYSNIL